MFSRSQAPGVSQWPCTSLSPSNSRELLESPLWTCNPSKRDFRQKEQFAGMLSQLVAVTFGASREFTVTQSGYISLFILMLTLVFPL